MDLVYDILASRTQGSALSDEAFLLATELVHAASAASFDVEGNKCDNVTQVRVAELLEADYENRFLEKMMERLTMVGDEITEHRRLQRFEPSEETLAILDVGIATAEYLSLLCEDHFLRNQNLLRAQPAHAGVVDIVKKVIELSILFCEDSTAVEHLSPKEVDILTTLFSLMSELSQGPCAENQTKLALSDAVVAIKTVVSLPEPPLKSRRTSRQTKFPEKDFALRAAAIGVAKSCLEGRHDLKVHKALAASLEVILLQDYEGKVEAIVEDLYSLRMSAEDSETLTGALDSIVDVKTIKAELMGIPSFASATGRRLSSNVPNAKVTMPSGSE